MIDFCKPFAIHITSAQHVETILTLLTDGGYRWCSGDSLIGANVLKWNIDGTNNLLWYTPTVGRCSFKMGNIEGIHHANTIHRSSDFYKQVRNGEFTGRVLWDNNNKVPNGVIADRGYDYKGIERPNDLNLNKARDFYNSENDILRKAALKFFPEKSLQPVSLETLAKYLKENNVPKISIDVECFDPVYYKKLLLRLKLFNLCYLMYGKREPSATNYTFYYSMGEQKLKIAFTDVSGSTIHFDSHEDAQKILKLLTPEEIDLLSSGL